MGTHSITQHNHTAAAALRVSDTTAISGHPPASSLTAPPSLHHEGSPSLPRCRIGPLRSRRCSIHETRCRLHSERRLSLHGMEGIGRQHPHWGSPVLPDLPYV